MTTDPVLELSAVSAGYGSTTVLHDITFAVPAGSVVALLGPNGAGKTTLLRTAAGLLATREGVVRLDGKDVTRRRSSHRARGGLCLIPEGRGVFPALSVRENLWLQQPRGTRRFDEALDVFPDLRGRLGQLAGSMSGGQQQMLALARAWLAHPSIVLLDEVSMGLAPLIVDEIFAALRRLAATGTSLLLVEQYVDQALAMADTVHLIDRGRIVQTSAADSLDRDSVLHRYLGVDTTPTP